LKVRNLRCSPTFPAATAAFELPCVTHALELLRELRTDWVGWIENGLDGTFVVVLAPERISDLNELMSRVEKWISAQDFLAIRFHLEGRAYIMQRSGFVGPGDRIHVSDS
jgi:hypothetical protein